MSSDNNVTCCIVWIILIVVVLYLGNKMFIKYRQENYQQEINEISRQNDLVKDKYPYQDVSQQNVAQQQTDYSQTLIKPQQLVKNYKQMYPDDLLPIQTSIHKEADIWSRANPKGSGSLELKNMLAAGQHLGVNTQGSSLKNANQQLRSEPPNPIVPVSIFYNSTITPDVFRKELEIGECAN